MRRNDPNFRYGREMQEEELPILVVGWVVAMQKFGIHLHKIAFSIGSINKPATLILDQGGQMAFTPSLYPF